MRHGLPASRRSTSSTPPGRWSTWRRGRPPARGRRPRHHRQCRKDDDQGSHRRGHRCRAQRGRQPAQLQQRAGPARDRPRRSRGRRCARAGDGHARPRGDRPTVHHRPADDRHRHCSRRAHTARLGGIDGVARAKQNSFRSPDTWLGDPQRRRRAGAFDAPAERRAGADLRRSCRRRRRRRRHHARRTGPSVVPGAPWGSAASGCRPVAGI